MKIFSEAALHEAGHAVIALATDTPIQEVTITRRGNNRGTCTIGKTDTQKRMLILLAGAAAQQLRADLLSGWHHTHVGFTPLNPTKIKRFGAWDDYQEFEKHQRAKYPPYSYFRTFDQMARRVQQTLYTHWRYVETIAVALDKQKTLPGAEVYRLAAGLQARKAAHTTETRVSTLAALRARKAALQRSSRRGAQTADELRDFREKYAKPGTGIFEMLTARIEGRAFRERRYTSGRVRVESRVAA